MVRPRDPLEQIRKVDLSCMNDDLSATVWEKGNKSYLKRSFRRREPKVDFFEAVKNRRSIRKYKSEPIPKEKMEMILEATRLAPSAANRQPWRFIIVQDQDRKKSLAEAANEQTFLSDAAAIAVAISDPDVSARWHEKDTMIAMEHMVLAATALGYGTCWIGAFNEDAVKHLLKIPAKMKVVALLPIGIPAEKPAPKLRKELAEIFFKEEWQTPWPAH